MVFYHSRYSTRAERRHSDGIWWSVESSMAGVAHLAMTFPLHMWTGCRWLNFCWAGGASPTTEIAEIYYVKRNSAGLALVAYCDFSYRREQPYLIYSSRSVRDKPQLHHHGCREVSFISAPLLCCSVTDCCISAVYRIY